MKYEFVGEISRLEGKIKWPVVYFPYPCVDEFGTKGNIPVIVTVDGHEFKSMLLPSKRGHYFVCNDFISAAVGKGQGDIVHVALERDLIERIFAAPPHIEAVLKEAGVFERFSAQPDYLQREQVNFIESAKKDETKANRLQKLVEKLKSMPQ